MDIPGGKVYQGSPKTIIVEISEEIANLLHKNSIHPTGVHILSLLHVAACAIRSGLDDKAQGKSTIMGDMPSLRLLLSVLTHGISGSDWDNEELVVFNKEFMAIVKSLGGSVLPAETPAPPMTYMSPMSKEVH